MVEGNEDREDRILGYGQEAVDGALDDVLDDSVLDPFNQGGNSKRGKKKASGKTLLITASGYGGFASTAKEIEAIESGIWLPHNADFNQTAAHTRGKTHFGASDKKQFIGAIEGASGKLSRIVFIGHGFSSGLGLSGDQLDLFGETFDETSIDEFQDNINQNIKPKLLKDAVFDIIACNVGVSSGFLSKMANAFGICIRAYDEEVLWCVSFNKANNQITGRGRIGPKSQVSGKKCSDQSWFRGVKKVVPPVKKCP